MRDSSTGRRMACATGARVLMAFVVAAWVALPATAQETKRLTPDEVASFSGSFVEIRIHVKQSEFEVEDDGGFGGWRGRMASPASRYETYIEAKTPIRLLGVAVSADTVLTMDIVLDEEYVDRIEVVDMSGNAAPAERLALIRRAPGLLLKILKPDALKLKPVSFADLPSPLSAGASFHEVMVLRTADAWRLRSHPIRPGVEFGNSGEQRLVLDSTAFTLGMDVSMTAMSLMSGVGAYTTSKSPTLILDGEKRPVGICLTTPVPFKEGATPLWIGKEVLSDDRVDFSAIHERREALKDEMAGRLLEIRLAFRQKAKDSGGMSLFGVSFDPSDYLGEDEMPDEMYCYGLCVGPRLLFVPSRIDREYAKHIETIEVSEGEDTVTGAFAGAFKDVAGFLVATDTDLAATPANLAEAPGFDEIEPYYTVHADRRFGGKWMQVAHTRKIGVTLGYADVLEPVMMGAQERGTFYVDAAGNVRGVLLGQRTEGEDVDDIGDPYARWDTTEWIRPFEMNELAALVSEPAEHLDKTIVALGEDEEHRRMWLGVEFDALNPELAETLGIQQHTKDGAIGLVVSTVYAGSPAERVGLKSGDVLLKLQSKHRRRPVELKEEEGYGLDFDISDMEMPAGLEAFGLKMPEKKRWKSRKNTLTHLLEVLGEGEDVLLTYLSDGQPKQASFTIEQAPADYDSARKVKAEDLGLTVKEVTYEVRHALRIPEAQNPVVVSKVEEGSPADVARIQIHELVVKIDDTEIAGLDSFEQALAAARAKKDAGKEVRLRVTVQKLQKTRIADVTLE